MNRLLNSPLRWTGSKKKLLVEMLYTFDNDKEIYIEPFLGSGIVLINLLNNKNYYSFKEYYVNDINSDVILFYKELKQNPEELIAGIKKIILKYNSLKTIKEKNDYYLDIRKKYNYIENSKKLKAIYFWFLMAGGFNGVYRVNKKGKFNVPSGKKECINVDIDKLYKISYLIQNVSFYNYNYEDFLSNLEKIVDYNKCFIYSDPPYIPEKSNSILYTINDFDHYGFNKFMEEVSVRTNASILISMTESEESDKIYGKYDWLKTDFKNILRSVNPKKQRKSKELLYSNYQIENRTIKKN